MYLGAGNYIPKSIPLKLHKSLECGESPKGSGLGLGPHASSDTQNVRIFFKTWLQNYLLY